MAQLSPVVFRALDDDGLPVSGAYFFIYEVNTTTPADIFTEATLTTPASNPVGPSDADGYFTQFFIASGQTVDLQMRRTSSVSSELFWQALDVDSVGNDDDSGLSRDFGGNGRFSVVGASGQVRIQVGPPTGDDIGGDAVICGQDGTPLDNLEIRGPVEITDGLTLEGSSKGAVTAVPVLELDLSANDFFTKSISSNSTFTFANATASVAQCFVLQLTITSAAVPTWPASVDHPNGANPSSGLGNGRHLLGFITMNGGTDWTMVVLARAAA